jgi:hypothetical protein
MGSSRTLSGSKGAANGGRTWPWTRRCSGRSTSCRAVSVGNLGLIKAGRRLHWPLSLRETAYAAERERIESLLPDALSQAPSGQVNVGTLRQLKEDVARLAEKLRGQMAGLSDEENIECKRFLA